MTGYGQRLYASDMTSDIGIAAIDPATGDVETLIQPKSLFPYFTIDQDGTLYLARNLDNSRESENQGAQLLAYDLNDLQVELRSSTSAWARAACWTTPIFATATWW